MQTSGNAETIARASHSDWRELRRDAKHWQSLKCLYDTMTETEIAIERAIVNDSARMLPIKWRLTERIKDLRDRRNGVPALPPPLTDADLVLQLQWMNHQALWAPTPSSDLAEDIECYVLAPDTGEGDVSGSGRYAPSAESEPEPEAECDVEDIAMPLPFEESDVEDNADDKIEDEPVCMPAAKGKKKKEEFPCMPLLDPKEKPTDFHVHHNREEVPGVQRGFEYV